jgi:beta-phosphoglucomutase
MPIRCVLFDFDGVIADTEERNADYLASALAHFGVRLTDADRSALVGINDPSLLEALLKRAETPVTLEQLQAERTRHGNYYENGADLHTQPGLREFPSSDEGTDQCPILAGRGTEPCERTGC